MEENKTLEIVAPEGYEIDKEKSTFEKIVFKPVEKVWRNDERIFIEGYFINTNSIIVGPVNGIRQTKTNRNVFATEKQAKSALAMAQISQIMENDPRFGGPITDEEWENSKLPKYVMCKYSNNLSRDLHYDRYAFLAFHTSNQRDLFLKENEDLVREYLMLD